MSSPGELHRADGGKPVRLVGAHSGGRSGDPAAGALRPTQSEGRGDARLAGERQPGICPQRPCFPAPPHEGPSYAGIGSRGAPAAVLAQIACLACSLARAGWVLRTGASPGCDEAFFTGAVAAQGPVELYLPWADFREQLWRATDPRMLRVLGEPTAAARRLAARTHPDWRTLEADERLLRARDVHEVLGADLQSNAGFVVCWTPGASLDGSGEPLQEGTAQALRVAHGAGVAVFNLARAGEERRVRSGRA
jgi:hypothetical protein